MTIEELVELQARRGLGDVHLVWFDEDCWRCAHTDAEREARDTVPLTACPFHQWMTTSLAHPYTVGCNFHQVYVVKKIPHDPTSQSFRSHHIPYTFEPLEIE